MLIIVAPVVVHPETDSKKASTKLIDKFMSNMNGKLPKKLNKTQKSTTIRNPSFIFILESKVLNRLGKKRREPLKKIIMKE